MLIWASGLLITLPLARLDLPLTQVNRHLKEEYRDDHWLLLAKRQIINTSKYWLA